jgi:hypothetical protein
LEKWSLNLFLFFYIIRFRINADKNQFFLLFSIVLTIFDIDYTNIQ